MSILAKDDILNSDIVAGERIGKFRLGMTLPELRELLQDKPYEEVEDEVSYKRIRITLPSIGFGIIKGTGKVNGITVSKEFKGKFLGKVGIGSTMAQVREVAGPFYMIDDGLMDSYQLKNYPGIGFTVEDLDTDEDEYLEPGEYAEWEAKRVPIERIYIFSDKRADDRDVEDLKKKLFQMLDDIEAGKLSEKEIPHEITKIELSKDWSGYDEEDPRYIPIDAMNTIGCWLPYKLNKKDIPVIRRYLSCIDKNKVLEEKKFLERYLRSKSILGK